MKAALWYNRKDVRIEETKDPIISSDIVKVKVKWCGICGSDLHEYLAGPILIPVEHPHPLSKTTAPVILGHEFSGEVVEIGENVKNIKVGDRVVGEPMVVCGKCPACLEGKYNLCWSVGAYGICGTGGGFAEYASLPERFIHKIPNELPFDKAALVEPITVGMHSIDRANFKIGETALVLGAGPIGLGTIECLKAAGASFVACLQRKSVRQEYAKNAGADIILDPNEVDIPSTIKKLTGGKGVDAVFETTGAESCFLAGLNSLKSDGTLVVTSIWEDSIKLNPNLFVFTEKKIVGTMGYRNNYPSTISLMGNGKIKADGWITKKIHLDDLVKEGFEILAGIEKKKHIKILVTPDKNLL
ncbi:2,3-butanediol dehydrogenase [Clostridium neuense]|uniref:2,3-butanediol dehydrogenase n=1 Tax=Clostridium neuense TaxID=1728934 RepID=A0ABW8TL29_9CLOT